mmetsp:Transcript_6098/g.15075  ORF Transcript_6098/g.15075 Transcript_6098/m.15075 type:complete len:331 (-) Transcript_6098:397-1389(-)
MPSCPYPTTLDSSCLSRTVNTSFAHPKFTSFSRHKTKGLLCSSDGLGVTDRWSAEAIDDVAPKVPVVWDEMCVPVPVTVLMASPALRKSCSFSIIFASLFSPRNHSLGLFASTSQFCPPSTSFLWRYTHSPRRKFTIWSARFISLSCFSNRSASAKRRRSISSAASITFASRSIFAFAPDVIMIPPVELLAADVPTRTTPADEDPAPPPPAETSLVDEEEEVVIPPPLPVHSFTAWRTANSAASAFPPTRCRNLPYSSQESGSDFVSSIASSCCQKFAAVFRFPHSSASFNSRRDLVTTWRWLCTSAKACRTPGASSAQTPSDRSVSGTT